MMSLMSLMTIINKRNKVSLNLNPVTFANSVVFNEILENIIQENVPLYDNDLLNEIMNYSKSYANETFKDNTGREGKITSKQEKSMDFINLLDNKVADYKERIIEFLRLSNISSSSLRKISSFC